ncbi:hypothetical protein NDA03_25440 [Trichocoleus sp. Lan]|uniref:HNH endonuclease domain-containing protein n=1 Tax=Trichocoleus sp. Lan TaxID=2933927 RepID=UPI0032977C4C
MGVEYPIVFNWFHEHTDPTAQTVTEIVQALHQINPSAATDFVQNYLGNLTQTFHRTSTHELPQSDRVNVSALSQILKETTNSYKYLFFLSLLDIIERSKLNVLSPVSFREIIIEMLANAWYPHNYFKLSFGSQDQIPNKLDSLNLLIAEPTIKDTKNKYKGKLKDNLIKSLKAENLDDIIGSISRYAPFRLLRPFFDQETNGLLDAKINQKVFDLANHKFKLVKPIYRFNSEQLNKCASIILHQDWVAYIAENYSIVRGWASWEWLEYMQKRNPNVPSIVNKIFMPNERGSLKNQKEYWGKVLGLNSVNCIYSGLPLSIGNFDLDHYLPWSFVTHDQLWNLIPVIPEANLAKSNNLPDQQYFNDFVAIQYLGLDTFDKNFSKKDKKSLVKL